MTIIDGYYVSGFRDVFLLRVLLYIRNLESRTVSSLKASSCGRHAALPDTSSSLGCIDKRRVVAKEFIVPVHSQKRPRRMHIVARISLRLP